MIKNQKMIDSITAIINVYGYKLLNLEMKLKNKKTKDVEVFGRFLRKN